MNEHSCETCSHPQGAPQPLLADVRCLQGNDTPCLRDILPLTTLIRFANGYNTKSTRLSVGLYDKQGFVDKNRPQIFGDYCRYHSEHGDCGKSEERHMNRLAGLLIKRGQKSMSALCDNFLKHLVSVVCIHGWIGEKGVDIPLAFLFVGGIRPRKEEISRALQKVIAERHGQSPDLKAMYEGVAGGLRCAPRELGKEEETELLKELETVSEELSDIATRLFLGDLERRRQKRFGEYVIAMNSEKSLDGTLSKLKENLLRDCRENALSSACFWLCDADGQEAQPLCLAGTIADRIRVKKSYVVSPDFLHRFHRMSPAPESLIPVPREFIKEKIVRISLHAGALSESNSVVYLSVFRIPGAQEIGMFVVTHHRSQDDTIGKLRKFEFSRGFPSLGAFVGSQIVGFRHSLEVRKLSEATKERLEKQVRFRGDVADALTFIQHATLQPLQRLKLRLDLVCTDLEQGRTQGAKDRLERMQDECDLTIAGVRRGLYIAETARKYDPETGEIVMASLGDQDKGFERIDLVELTKDLYDSSWRTIGRPDVRLANPMLINNALPEIWGHKQFVRDLIEGLLTNALKYSYSGTHIGSRYENVLYKGVPALEVRIQSVGIEIPGEMHGGRRFWERIFNLGYRSPQAKERDLVLSTGTGLWLAKYIMRLHGGDIRVHESDPIFRTSDGQQAFRNTFIVVFPTRRRR